ncbi:MAG: thioredoxin [Rudaea sp.]
MSASEVNATNFDEAVLRASAQRPVLVDFWAPWCGPCRALSPILDRLAEEYAGRFTLAKLNTDEEPEIAARYGVRGIPNCKLFVDGAVADEFTGALPESALRDFLARALPSPAAPLLLQAKDALARGDARAALATLATAERLAPDDEDVLLTRAEALLANNEGAAANAIVAALEARTGARAVRDTRRLASLAARAALASGAGEDLAALARAAAAVPVDCRAKLEYAKALAANGDYEHALAELLAIVKTDRAFGDDAARRTMVTIFDALPADSDLVRRYRRELASALN